MRPEREERLLFVGLAVIAALLALVLLAGLVAYGRTQALDELLLTRLRRPDNPAVPIGPFWLEQAAIDLTALGSAAVLVTLLILVLGFFAMTGRYRLLLVTLAAAVGGLVLSAALKGVVGRARPSIVPQLQHATSPSFPSGHSVLSAAVYLTLGVMLARSTAVLRERVFYVAAAMLLSFVVGLTRMYLGVHYPTDVLAGWLAGFCWAAFCALAAHVLERRGRLDSG